MSVEILCNCGEMFEAEVENSAVLKMDGDYFIFLFKCPECGSTGHLKVVLNWE